MIDGFIYLWRDRKRRMYYLGSHVGEVDDRYVCSSIPMLNAYRKRPKDFRRRILVQIKGSHLELLSEELRWLKMMDPNELGSRYYNLTTIVGGGILKGGTHSLDTRLKISRAMIETMKKPERRSQAAEHVRAMNNDPVKRAKINAAVSRYGKSQIAQEHCRRQLEKINQDPENKKRAAVIGAVALSNPEAKRKHAEGIRRHLLKRKAFNLSTM